MGEHVPLNAPGEGIEFKLRMGLKAASGERAEGIPCRPGKAFRWGNAFRRGEERAAYLFCYFFDVIMCFL